jgi:hypothetical protein
MRSLVLLALACTHPTSPSTGPGSLPAGSPCLAATDCATGICEGEGCGDDAPGVCIDPMRPCTRDLRAYCGCDGETFRTSGTCPNRRFAHREACEGDPALPTE